VTLWLLVVGYVPAVFKVHCIAVPGLRADTQNAAVLTWRPPPNGRGRRGRGRQHLDGLALALPAVFVAEGLVTLLR
jgi:hypothetical protein